MPPLDFTGGRPHTHDIATRAMAVADVLQGMTLHTAGAKYGVAPTTIQMWKREAALALSPAHLTRETGVDLAHRVAEYLDAGIAALSAQARLFSDPEWLAGQKVEGLIALHTSLGGQLVRVAASLEGVPAARRVMGPAPGDDEEGPPPGSAEGLGMDR